MNYSFLLVKIRSWKWDLSFFLYESSHNMPNTKAISDSSCHKFIYRIVSFIFPFVDEISCDKYSSGYEIHSNFLEIMCRLIWSMKVDIFVHFSTKLVYEWFMRNLGCVCCKKLIVPKSYLPFLKCRENLHRRFWTQFTFRNA